MREKDEPARGENRVTGRTGHPDDTESLAFFREASSPAREEPRFLLLRRFSLRLLVGGRGGVFRRCLILEGFVLPIVQSIEAKELANEAPVSVRPGAAALLRGWIRFEGIHHWADTECRMLKAENAIAVLTLLVSPYISQFF